MGSVGPVTSFGPSAARSRLPFTTLGAQMIDQGKILRIDLHQMADTAGNEWTMAKVTYADNRKVTIGVEGLLSEGHFIALVETSMRRAAVQTPLF